MTHPLRPANDPRAADALSDGDLAAWVDYARHVTPLPGRRPAERPGGPPGEPAAPPVSAASRVTTPDRMRPSWAPLRIGDAPPGLDSATWTRFRSGRIRAARVLDLHGHTVHRAYQALLAALRSAHADRLRCIEVITGRGSGEGSGVILRELPLWLNLPDLRPLVLAAAHPHPANPGATRLLLRRSRGRTS